MPIVVEQVVAVLLEEAGPTVLVGDLTGLVVRRLRPLVAILRNSKYVNCST